MTEPEAPAPGERRLAHAPSDRYRAAEEAAAAAVQPRAVSPGKGIAAAAVVAIIGAVVITVLGGVLTMTGGLLVLAGLIGWGIAAGLKTGGGASIAASRRAWLAAAFALGSIVLGQVGLWLYAGTEGGVLPLLDYLGETFGPLVPIQIVIAPVVAWVTAR